jgi:hypothetical protein
MCVRARRYGAAGLLLVALWAAGPAPLDHHAAEADPHHDHLVLTDSGITWTSSLPPHAHGAAAAHSHALPDAAPEDEATVVLTLPLAPAATLLGLAGCAVLAPAPATTPVGPRRAVASVWPPAGPEVGGLALAPADPPPRPV